jgi:hypothetical protein
MSDHVTVALDEMLLATWGLQQADEHPDPVEQRRLRVRSAKHLRRAADELDDHGALTE